MNMTERNAAICAYYQSGRKITECAEKFGLDRQRVYQILKAAKVWRPYKRRVTRTAYVGIFVSPDTKTKLQAVANKHGRSVSRFASEALDAIVNNKEVSR